MAGTTQPSISNNCLTLTGIYDKSPSVCRSVIISKSSSQVVSWRAGDKLTTPKPATPLQLHFAFTDDCVARGCGEICKKHIWLVEMLLNVTFAASIAGKRIYKCVGWPLIVGTDGRHYVQKTNKWKTHLCFSLADLLYVQSEDGHTWREEESLSLETLFFSS